MSRDRTRAENGDTLKPYRSYPGGELTSQEERSLAKDILPNKSSYGHKDLDQYSEAFAQTPSRAYDRDEGTYPDAYPHDDQLHAATYAIPDLRDPIYDLTYGHPNDAAYRSRTSHSGDISWAHPTLGPQQTWDSLRDADGLESHPRAERDYLDHHYPYHQGSHSTSQQKTSSMLGHHPSSHWQQQMGSTSGAAGRSPVEPTKRALIDQELRRLGTVGLNPAVDQTKLAEPKRFTAEELKNRSYHEPLYRPPEPSWGLPRSYPSIRGFEESEIYYPTYRMIPPDRSVAHQTPYIIPPTYFPTPQPAPYPQFPIQTYHSPPRHHLYSTVGERVPVTPTESSQYPHRSGGVEVVSPNTMEQGFDLFKFVGIYYGSISDVYEQSAELELKQILDRPLDSVLVSDPFSNPIPVNFGYGNMKSLNEYGVDKEKLDCLDAICLDDLYLFEQVLRNDKSLGESDRLRRWTRRMRWEAMSNWERKRHRDMMSETERRMLGLGPGGWWAYRLEMIPLDDTYGNHRAIIGSHGLFKQQHAGFMRGTFEAHYPLSSDLKDRYPSFWRDGGFGLGRSLIKWLELPATEDIPTSNAEVVSPILISPAVNDTTIQALVETRQEAELKQYEEQQRLIARKIAAENRRARLLASVQAQVMGPLLASGLPPPSSRVPSHPDRAKLGLVDHLYTSTYPPDHYPSAYDPSYRKHPPGIPTHKHSSSYPASAYASSSNHHWPTSGLPWGSLLPEIRKHDGKRTDAGMNPKSTRPNLADSSTKQANSQVPDSHKRFDGIKLQPIREDYQHRDEKRIPSQRMDSSSSRASHQVQPPPAYHQPHGSSATGLPHPPKWYDVKDFDKNRSTRTIPERRPTTRDI